MATIAIPILNSDRVMVVDESDAALEWGYRVYFDKAERNQYAIGSVPGVSGCHKMHRVILGLSKGDGKIVDHIDGNKLNNTRANLRIATPQQNRINEHKLATHNTSGVTGVSYKRDKMLRRKRWCAQLRVFGKTIYLGYFATLEEARKARSVAEMKYYGQVCPTNRTVN